MTPVSCQTVTSAHYKTTGDCVRACVASLLDLPAVDVPHFFHDDCPGEIANRRMREFLAPRGLAPFFTNFPGSLDLPDLLEMFAILNPSVPIILYGATQYGDHVVICRDGHVIHDPASLHEPLIKCGSHGHWTALVIAKL